MAGRVRFLHSLSFSKMKMALSHSSLNSLFLGSSPLGEIVMSWGRHDFKEGGMCGEEACLDLWDIFWGSGISGRQC